MSELDGLLNPLPDGRKPPAAPDEAAPVSRSRETAGLPAVERWLGDEPDLAGRTLGGFRIEKRLGSGAVGTVYLAEQLALGRPVALKVLAGARAANSEYLARFVREARVVARLVHPNAVQVYDVGEADGYHYIALEYVEGQTVAELLERRGRLPWKAALEIVRQAATSLGRAHEMGIVHRDIKPENLMINGRGEIKVTDFGLARLGGDPSITHHGTILGTPFYMSPEQAAGEPAGPAADIYSLGATLYQMIVGNPPFEALTALEVVHKHVVEAPRSPAELVSEVPKPVSDLVLWMMAKDPLERPASARELIDLVAEARRRAEGQAAPEVGRLVIVQQVLGPEGRAYTRVASELVAEARPAELPTGARDKLAARVINLSEGGLFLACEDPAAAGTLLELSFRQHEGAELVEALAVVRWVAEQPRGMGLEFVKLSGEERARIRSMVDRAEAEAAIADVTRTELHRRLLRVCCLHPGRRQSLAELAESAGTGVVMVREGLRPFVRHGLARLTESQAEFRQPPADSPLASRLRAWILEHGLANDAPKPGKSE